VNVTNTGSIDADDVVLGFLVPPNAGVDGAPLQTLFGFERVHVPAGQTVSVFIYPALADFVQTDSTGKRVAVAGEWKVRFGIPEVAPHGQGFVEHTLTLTA
jgi:beta-D-xylosidase 4